MAILRIHDLKQHCLAFDLKDLMRLLAPWSLKASWVVSPVKSSLTGYEWFEATGNGGERLGALAEHNARLSGADLMALAENTYQVITGDFLGSGPAPSGEVQVLIRAFDSTFYEIDTDDEAVLSKIRSTYEDVRPVEALTT